MTSASEIATVSASPYFTQQKRDQNYITPLVEKRIALPITRRLSRDNQPDHPPKQTTVVENANQTRPVIAS